MNIALILILILGVTINPEAQCCSGGVPVSGTVGQLSGEAKTWQFQLSYDYNVLQDLFEGSESLNDRSRKRSTHSILMEVNYGISDRLAISGLLSWVRQERLVRSIVNQDNFTSTQGVGDGIVLVKYNLTPKLQFNNYRLTLGAGIKAPIGGTDHTDGSGLSLPADLQPGSGAWDGLLFSLIDIYRLWVDNLSMALVTSYRHTGTNDEYFGSQNYRFGNEFSVNLQLSNRFLIKSSLIDGSLGIRYRNQGSDKIDDQEFPNSGGNFVFLIPGLTYGYSPDLSFRVSGHVPLYRNVGGTQLSTSYKLTGSVLWKIKRNKGTKLQFY